MGLGEGELTGKLSKGSPSVSCSICLEVVTEGGDRSIAKLRCSHEFHLDCIGSEFNAKGVMQCPNCRKVEKGQWLFANGYRSFEDFAVDEWAHDEDLYDLRISELPFGFQWCPYRGFSQFSASFEDGEEPLNTHQELLGHLAALGEYSHASSSSTHACPHLAMDGFSHPEILHHNWQHHHHSSSSHFSPMSSQANVPSQGVRMNNEMESSAHLRGSSFLQPFPLGHTSGPRVSAASNPRAHHARVHAFIQQQHQQAGVGVAPPPVHGSGPTPIFPQGRGAVTLVSAWERERYAPFPWVPLDGESHWLGGPFYNPASLHRLERPGHSQSGSRPEGAHATQMTRMHPFT
ncbi:hypothetical protein AMTRI_Chr02g222760 [Amborella trichopoda]